MLHYNGDRTISGKRDAPRQAMKQHNPKRVNVASPVHRLGLTAGSLLRGHILRRPDTCPNASEVRRTFKNFRNTHVRDQEMTIFTDQHIGRLHITMDDAIAMSAVKSLSRLNDIIDSFWNREESLKTVLECATIDIFHGNIG